MVPTRRVWNKTKGWQNVGYITEILSSMNGWWCKYYCFIFLPSYGNTITSSHVLKVSPSTRDQGWTEWPGLMWGGLFTAITETHYPLISARAALTKDLQPKFPWQEVTELLSSCVLLSMTLSKPRCNVSWDIQIPLTPWIHSRNETSCIKSHRIFWFGKDL